MNLKYEDATGPKRLASLSGYIILVWNLEVKWSKGETLFQNILTAHVINNSTEFIVHERSQNKRMRLAFIGSFSNWIHYICLEFIGQMVGESDYIPE